MRFTNANQVGFVFQFLGASPAFHVDRRDPPLLLLHGDQDPQMPINQSLELCGAYRKVKALEVVHGAAHGGAMFYDAWRW